MSKLTLGLLAMLLLYSRIGFAQSGWTKDKGEWYAQLSAATFTSDDYYGLDGTLNENVNQFRQRFLNLYAEYGITSRLTGILQAPLLRMNSYVTTNVVAAPGDLRLELKYALSKKIPLSISVAPEIPIAPKDNFATAKEPNDFGIREQVNLATTDGEINVWTTLAASTGLPKGLGWASLWSSYNLRSKGFSDQVFSGLELGYKPSAKFYLKGRLTTLVSLGDPKPNVPFFRGEGTEMTAASLGAGWQFAGKWGLTVDVFKCFDFIVSPKNTYAAPVFTLGVFYKTNL